MSTFFPLEDEVTCPLGTKLSGSLCGRLLILFSLSSQHMKKTFLATGWITTIVVSLGRVQRRLLSLSVCQASFPPRPSLHRLGTSSSTQPSIVLPLFVKLWRSMRRYLVYFHLT